MQHFPEDFEIPKAIGRLNCSLDTPKSKENKVRLLLMMPISIGTGLERVGVVGPELELSLGRPAGTGRWTNLQKQETKRIGRDSPVAAPMPKSVLP